VTTGVPGSNVDESVVEGFGQEWQRFDQSSLSDAEARALFQQYFEIFPWDTLAPGATGFDAGCGSGRWARFVAPRVGLLHCVDASAEALGVARRTLAGAGNCRFHLSTIDNMPLADGTADFGYSLGVLHHIPDTEAALRACVGKLKPGAPFLLYLYYAFDNRPAWFRAVWRASEIVRRTVSRAPFRVRSAVSDMLAAAVYWPLARTARIAEGLGMDVDQIPLSAYRARSFYVMRTDALDRFGTRLEKRFSREQMSEMMRGAGLTAIRFHAGPPYWVGVGRKA
jgi:SAM-dependent methyltransferase